MIIASSSYKNSSLLSGMGDLTKKGYFPFSLASWVLLFPVDMQDKSPIFFCSQALVKEIIYSNDERK
nr:hypothetical protein [[Mycoplasma] phocae]